MDYFCRYLGIYYIGFCAIGIESTQVCERNLRTNVYSIF
jgi:hypothetical protein